VFEIAAAKLRANQAIGVATSTAHQVHGAIGFTYEYALRHATQRLWSWRSEYGNDRYWSEQLGRAVIARGADTFWDSLTRA
jgi:alkylation response protein AidB-like acyl-CoA dehydrogenase